MAGRCWAGLAIAPTLAGVCVEISDRVIVVWDVHLGCPPMAHARTLQHKRIDEFLTLYRYKKESKMRNRQRNNPEVPRLMRYGLAH